MFIVSNSPCGVERDINNVITALNMTFLIHRVELKVKGVLYGEIAGFGF